LHVCLTPPDAFAVIFHGALPADLASQALGDPACAWLWRSLREAEAAGLDGADFLQQAVASRSMSGARDVARVLDSRVRHMLDGVQPHPFRPWTEHVPSTGFAGLDRYLSELAAAMDDRVRRLGEHAAATQPSWARQALGPVPADPVARLEWEQRASLVAAYRERYGYAHPADPIGPAPAKTSPEARAAWHAALGALGRVHGIDLVDPTIYPPPQYGEAIQATSPGCAARQPSHPRITTATAHIQLIISPQSGMTDPIFGPPTLARAAIRMVRVDLRRCGLVRQMPGTGLVDAIRHTRRHVRRYHSRLAGPAQKDGTDLFRRHSLAPLDQTCDLGIVLVLRSISGP
jgi:hypothetical protein